MAGLKVSQDRGWAWIVLVSGCVVMGIVLCIPYVYSILFRNLLSSFGSSSTSVSWIFSTYTFCFNISVILCAPISTFWGYRVPGVLTCFMLSIGMFSSSFSDSQFHLIFTFGILSGIGSGISATLAYLVIASYFHEYRGLAIGLSLASASIARIISPFFISYLIEQYGDRGAQMIFSAVVLNSCAAFMTFRPPPSPPQQLGNLLQDLNGHETKGEKIEENKSTPTDSGGKSIAGLFSTVLQSIDTRLLKNPMFILMLLIDCFGWLVLYSTPVLIPYYVDSIGLHGKGILILSLIPIFDLMSRMIAPSLTDTKYFSTSKGFLVAGTLTSFGITGLILARNTPGVISAACIYGFGVGAVTTLFGLLLISFFGIDRLPSALGIIAIFKAFFTLIAGTLIGFLRDVMGTYLGSLAFLNACSVAIVVLFCFEPLANKYNRYLVHQHSSLPTREEEVPI